MIIVFILFSILLLIVPVGFRIIYDETYSDIDVYLFSFIRYKFDIDEFLRKFYTDKIDSSKISLRELLNNIELTINSRKILKKIFKITKIKKSTIILKENYDNTLLFITFWSFVSRYRYFINKYFKKVENEYYMISNCKKDFNFELIFSINVWKILVILLFSLKDIISVIKVRRRQKRNGTSNL